MLPSHATIYAAPCELAEYVSNKVDFWDSVTFRFLSKINKWDFLRLKTRYSKCLRSDKIILFYVLVFWVFKNISESESDVFLSSTNVHIFIKIVLSGIEIGCNENYFKWRIFMYFCWYFFIGAFLPNQVYGFKMAPFKEVVLGRQRTLCAPEIQVLKPEQILSEPQVLAEFDLARVQASDLVRVTKRSFVSVNRDGVFQGIALWFDTSFAPRNEGGSSLLENEVVLKTGPFDPATHWQQTVLVLPKREVDKELTDEGSTY